MRDGIGIYLGSVFNRVLGKVINEIDYYTGYYTIRVIPGCKIRLCIYFIRPAIHNSAKNLQNKLTSLHIVSNINKYSRSDCDCKRISDSHNKGFNVEIFNSDMCSYLYSTILNTNLKINQI